MSRKTPLHSRLAAQEGDVRVKQRAFLVFPVFLQRKLQPFVKSESPDLNPDLNLDPAEHV